MEDQGEGIGTRPTVVLGIAPGRGLPSRHLSMPLVRAYRALARAARASQAGHRWSVSVALSSLSTAPDVTRQAWTLGSTDFPQPAAYMPRG